MAQREWAAKGQGEGHGEGKKGCKGTTEYEAIPTMSCTIALFCCLLNCAIPGCGTILAGLCCSKDEEIDGKPVWKINCFTGFAQLFTSLCFFGLLWNWLWGCYMIGKSRACNDDSVRNNPVITQQPISTGQVAIITQSTGVPFVGNVVAVGGMAVVVQMAAPGPEMYPPVYPPPPPPPYQSFTHYPPGPAF